MIKRIWNNIIMQLSVLIVFTVTAAYCYIYVHWFVFFISALFIIISFFAILRLFRQHRQKIEFMLEAIENDDYAFRYSSKTSSSSEKIVNEVLNKITRILLQAKTDAIDKEKYYELIMDNVNTGIVVVDNRGFVLQANKEALRLLGINNFSNVVQLRRIDESLERAFSTIQHGDKEQVSFINERGSVSLSLRASATTLKGVGVHIIVINDINKELENQEDESWNRLIRVLTHEIMNSITPITSLSNSLLSMHTEADEEIRNGLEVIGSTSKNLIDFVENYRKYTHIPTPEPSLFYVDKFLKHIVQLVGSQKNFENIKITVDVKPEDLIVHADESMISQIILNILKNAAQALSGKAGGQILLEAHCANDESVVIDISNNGTKIDPEQAKQIFVPFYTTKNGGSGIGLSISRQIMRLSGGSISLINNSDTDWTTFRLTFP